MLATCREETPVFIEALRYQIELLLDEFHAGSRAVRRANTAGDLQATFSK